MNNRSTFESFRTSEIVKTSSVFQNETASSDDHFASLQKFDAKSYEDVYQQADLFLDSVNVYIVAPEPSRKKLSLIQYKLKGLVEKELVDRQTLALSSNSLCEIINKTTEKIDKEYITENAFDLKPIKESPLLLRRKLAPVSSMKIPICF